MKSKKDRYTEAHNLFYTLIFSAVNIKVDNLDDVKDICQEVFYKFYEKFDNIKDHRKWLYGALRLAVLEYYRKKNNDTTISIDDVFNDMNMVFVNGLKNARIIIREAIENIDNFNNETNKTLFDLIAIHNFSYSETGRELGLTKRQVEYRYKKAVDEIIDYLKKMGIDSLEELL